MTELTAPTVSPVPPSTPWHFLFTLLPVLIALVVLAPGVVAASILSMVGPGPEPGMPEGRLGPSTGSTFWTPRPYDSYDSHTSDEYDLIWSLFVVGHRGTLDGAALGFEALDMLRRAPRACGDRGRGAPETSPRTDDTPPPSHTAPTLLLASPYPLVTLSPATASKDPAAGSKKVFPWVLPMPARCTASMSAPS